MAISLISPPKGWRHFVKRMRCCIVTSTSLGQLQCVRMFAQSHAGGSNDSRGDEQTSVFKRVRRLRVLICASHVK
jgi:hypothetical protein